MLLDFTITPDTRCHLCGYALLGLRPTGRCPECGTRVVETLYFASVRRERRAEARSQWAFEWDVFRGEWRVSLWLGALGALLLAAWGVEAALRGVPPGIALPTAVLAFISTLSMRFGLRVTERLGIAGFPSRRAMWGLAILLHLFAAGVTLTMAQRSALVGAALLLPPIAAVPVGLVLRRNAPEPWLATLIVMCAQGLACGLLLVVRFAL